MFFFIKHTCGVGFLGPEKKYKKGLPRVAVFFIFGDSVLKRDSMDIEEQEQKFDQSLDQLSHSTTRLTNTLVCHVTERSPQLYVKTKLRLLSSIGALSKAVVKVQQARNELSFFRLKVGSASTGELSSPSLLAKGKKEKKAGKRVASALAPSGKRGRKKMPAQAAFSNLSDPLEEEQSYERVFPTQPPQTLDKEIDM